MKAKMRVRDLLRSLDYAQGVVPKKPVTPALGSVMISATTPETASVLATDLEIGMVSVVAAQVECMGSVLIDAKRLYEILQKLPDDEMVMAVGGGRVEIKCNGSVYKLLTAPTDDFPDMINTAGIGTEPVEAGALLNAINTVSYAVSSDQSRPALNGVHVAPTGKLVATDGSRLAVMYGSLPTLPLAALPLGVIVPAKGIMEIRRLLMSMAADARCQIGSDEKTLVFKNDKTVIMIRLLDGTYPDWEQAIPKKFTKNIMVLRDELIDGVKKVKPILDKDCLGARLTSFNEALEIFATNADVGEASSRVHLTGDCSGGVISICVNIQYLLDALSAMDCLVVHVQMEDDISPMVLTPSVETAQMHVIMPMRL